MALKRFKSDRAVWFWISLALFVIPWFIPILGDSSYPAAAKLWVVLFTEPDAILFAAPAIAGCTLIFGVPAIGVGWVLQSLFVMIRDSKTKRIDRRRMQSPEG